MDPDIHKLYDLLEEADEYDGEERFEQPFPRMIYGAYIGEEED